MTFRSQRSLTLFSGARDRGGASSHIVRRSCGKKKRQREPGGAKQPGWRGEKEEEQLVAGVGGIDSAAAPRTT